MDTNLISLIDLFLATKQTEGKTRQTLAWYRKRLTAFARYLGPNASVKDITLPNGRVYVAHLQGRETRYDGHPLTPKQQGGLSPHTISGHVRAVKVFSNWLAEEGYLGLDVLGKLKRPKVPDTLIEILTNEEIECLFGKEGMNPNGPLGARMYTVCWLMLDTGIRAGELCTLKMDNVYLEQNCIKVFGKGQKERIVNFGAQTKKHLLRYLTLWRPETDSPTLFVTTEGTPITYSSLAQMVRRVGKKYGIPRLHVHLFRHTFAVKFLLRGGDLNTLRLLLGHTTIAVTQMYLKLTHQNVADVYARNSPMDQFDFRKRAVAAQPVP